MMSVKEWAEDKGYEKDALTKMISDEREDFSIREGGGLLVNDIDIKFYRNRSRVALLNIENDPEDFEVFSEYLEIKHEFLFYYHKEFKSIWEGEPSYKKWSSEKVEYDGSDLNEFITNLFLSKVS